MTARRAGTRESADPSGMDHLRQKALDAMRQKRHSLVAALDEFEHVACLHAPPRSFFPAESVSALLDPLAHHFAAHVAATEALYAPLLAPLEPDPTELGTMFAAFRETLARPAHRERDEQLRVQAADLVALLRSHLRKEETLVFAMSRPAPKKSTPRGDRS